MTLKNHRNWKTHWLSYRLKWEVNSFARHFGPTSRRSAFRHPAGSLFPSSFLIFASGGVSGWEIVMARSGSRSAGPPRGSAARPSGRSSWSRVSATYNVSSIFGGHPEIPSALYFWCFWPLHLALNLWSMVENPYLTNTTVTLSPSPFSF